MHLPLHVTAPAGQLRAQVPLVQRSLPSQACPQLPQFARSVVVSLHSLLHGTVPGAQTRATHAESSQCSVAAHVLLHCPQCFALVRVSVHPSLQSVRSPSHTVFDEESVPDDALDEEALPLPSMNDPADGRFDEQAKRSPGVMQAMTTAALRVQVGFMTLRDRSIKGCSMIAAHDADPDSSGFGGVPGGGLTSSR